MKVETDNIVATPVGRDVIIYIVCQNTFKADVISFSSNVIMCLTSH
jgi:hypothetical protein